MIGFLLVTVWVNGPISPLLPTTYEPILMLYGRLYRPLLVAIVGTAGTLYVELLNYYLYRQLTHTGPLQDAVTNRTARWLVTQFARAPFFSVWLAAFTPLPYWVVRFLSPMAGYPVSRHLWATALGRFPRLWFFAALGVWWRVDTRILLAITVLSIAVACVVWATKRRRAQVAT
jgi:membrane protein DedA with SNARE-associated domain